MISERPQSVDDFQAEVKGKLLMRFALVRCLSLISTVFSFSSGCATLDPFGKTLRKDRIPEDWASAGKGWASFYGSEFIGRKTASGEVYDEGILTAAHPTLPFGTIVLVRRVATGRYAVVRVTDRGPFVANRAIDLSRAAAAKIGLLAAGVGRVELFVIPPQHSLIAHL
ncbi:septal ring lytic transglycosylase RlpA family protein [bacterium]|nr:septal ring lytic transglycosylase RlpA family protein [bacterium]